MTETGIELRDTWAGAENENFEVQQTPGDGPCFFVTEKYSIEGFNSLTYKNPIIVLPEQYGGAAHPVIHEAVHFLQRNDWTIDAAYFKVRKFTDAGFKEFVSQQQETEAHFIQMLFIARYESYLVKPRELDQFRKRIFKAINQPSMRVAAICWAVRNNIFLKQASKG